MGNPASAACKQQVSAVCTVRCASAQIDYQSWAASATVKADGTVELVRSGLPVCSPQQVEENSSKSMLAPVSDTALQAHSTYKLCNAWMDAPYKAFAAHKTKDTCNMTSMGKYLMRREMPTEELARIMQACHHASMLFTCKHRL